MSNTRPSITEVGLPEHVESLKDTSNGCGWITFVLCMNVGLGDTSIGKLFNKHRKTIAGWRRLYKQGGYNGIQ